MQVYKKALLEVGSFIRLGSSTGVDHRLTEVHRAGPALGPVIGHDCGGGSSGHAEVVHQS